MTCLANFSLSQTFCNNGIKYVDTARSANVTFEPTKYSLPSKCLFKTPTTRVKSSFAFFNSSPLNVKIFNAGNVNETTGCNNSLSANDTHCKICACSNGVLPRNCSLAK